jgi:A/G-specific adenine glycosylase
MHKAMQQLAKSLAVGNETPRTYDEWKELPGIGPYTAAAISSIAFNYPAVVVDGNVERVVCRIMDWRIPPNARQSKARITKIAELLLAKDSPSDFNQGLMELGQLVCTPTNPSCDQCPVAANCASKSRSSQHLAPAPKIKPDKKQVQLQIMIPMQKSGKIGIALRDKESPFLKGSVGFPLRISARVPAKNSVEGTFKHSITNNDISAFVTRFRPTKLSAYKWYASDEIKSHLLASLDLKALKILDKKKAP